MKNLKLKISRILSITLIFISLFTFPVQASESDDLSDKIEQLFEQRSSFIMSGEYDKLDMIDNQLESLGVHKMSEQEVTEFIIEHSNIETYVTKPTDGAITWYSNRDYMVYEGITYEIQTLRATPNSNNSSLKGASSGDEDTLNSTKKVAAAAMNMLKTCATGYLGQVIPTFDKAWSVYDFISPFIKSLQPSSEVISTTVIYSYSWAATISFKYVKKVGQSDDYQAMAYVSSKCEAAIGWQCPTFFYDSNGIAHPNILQGSENVNAIATGYDGNESAIKAYLNPTAQRTSFVNYIEAKGIEDHVIFAIWLPTPSSPLLLLN